MKLVIFGTGKAAESALSYIDVPVSYCVDNNQSRWGTSFYNLDVYPPKKLLEEDHDQIYIIVASSYYLEIAEQLRSMGFLEYVHFNVFLASGQGFVSYSQEGEDLVLKRIFENKQSGFYVDVGAHQPIRFSNTYMFYRLGWNGINIDPYPGMKKMFDIYRPRDINLEAGISDVEGKLKYFMFNEPALNTFDSRRAKEILESVLGHEIIREVEIEVFKLSSVLEKYASGKKIDFMSIDTEGFDLQVLQSNDWDLFVPEVILVEILNCELEQMHSHPIHQFLMNRGYRLISKLFNTCIYKRV